MPNLHIIYKTVQNVHVLIKLFSGNANAIIDGAYECPCMLITLHKVPVVKCIYLIKCYSPDWFCVYLYAILYPFHFQVPFPGKKKINKLQLISFVKMLKKKKNLHWHMMAILWNFSLYMPASLHSV